MTMNAGVIKYEVEAGTASLLKAEAQVNKSISSVVDDFDRADRAVREFESTQKSLGRTINSMGQVVNKNGKIVAASTIQYRKLAEQAQTAFNRTTTASNGASKAFKLQKGASQQLGFQLQDMAVQAQMGISAFTILGQQGSQLAGVFGPGGALVGAAIAVASAIGGVMYAALSKTEKKIEDVTYKTENYKEKLDNLTFSQAQASIVKFRDENKQLSDQLQVAGNVLDRVRNQSRRLSLQLDEEGKFTGKSAKENEKKYKQLQKDYVTAGANYDTIKQKIKENEAAVKTLTEAQDRHRQGLQNTNNESNRNTAEITNMITALNLQAETIGMTEKETALYVATLMKATEAEKAAISKHYETINVYKDEQEAIRETMAAIAEFEEFEKDSASRRAGLEKRVSSIGLTPLQEIKAQFARELELLREAEEAGIAIKGEYSERYKQLKLEENQAIEALNKKQQETTADAFDSLASKAANSLGQVVMQAQDGEDAIRSLAKSILTTLITSIVKQGIASMTTQAAVTSAQVASNTTIAASAAPAAALTSLASFGSNSIPAMAGIAAVTAATLAIGGREFGGPVSGGSMYRVGERGPEIFTSGGRQYMIPGENGQVTNNNKIGGSSETNNVNVSLTVPMNTPDEFRNNLMQNGELIAGIIQQSQNDKGRKF